MRSPFRIVILLCLVSVFLYVANLVVYEGLALTFTIGSTGALVALGVVLGVLPACFIGMMILGSYYYNAFTRAAYTLLAAYMGAFAYLFFASVTLGVVSLAALWLDAAIPFQRIGVVLYVGAALVSIYGVWHAKQITQARYDVRLPNLPPEWKGKKALFMSDLHLGQIHGPKFAEKVARTVMAEKPDIIFIGGDMYDGTQAPNPLTLAEPLRALTAPWGVFYITGNHEEFGDNTIFVKAVKALGIGVLFDEKADVHGLQLLGVDYYNANSAEGFANILAKLSIDKSKPSILLKHEPNNLHIAEEAGVSLQISGHTHYGQQWPFGLLAQLSYQGYAYGLKDFKNMQMLTSSGVGSWGPPVRVGSNAEIVLITFV